MGYQESYDHSGLQIGDPEQECSGVMLSVETTQAVLQECREKGCNLLLCHHPILFKPLHRVGTETYQERCVAMAIRYNIVVYALHTNADNHLTHGINRYIADKIGIKPQSRRPLVPLEGTEYKLQVMVPEDYAAAVRRAMHSAGAGTQGHYSQCSFSFGGEGRFTPKQGANPFIGQQEKPETTREVCISILCPEHLLGATLSAMRAAHPYEEPAYEVIPLKSRSAQFGSGLIGELSEPRSAKQLLRELKTAFNTPVIAHSRLSNPREILTRVALCGGAGESMLPEAWRQGAQMFITGEAKYNRFLDTAGRTLLVTIGHHPGETVIRELLSDALAELCPSITPIIAQTDADPISYL